MVELQKVYRSHCLGDMAVGVMIFYSNLARHRLTQGPTSLYHSVNYNWGRSLSYCAKTIDVFPDSIQLSHVPTIPQGANSRKFVQIWREQTTNIITILSRFGRFAVLFIGCFGKSIDHPSTVTWSLTTLAVIIGSTTIESLLPPAIASLLSPFWSPGGRDWQSVSLGITTIWTWVKSFVHESRPVLP